MDREKLIEDYLSIKTPEMIHGNMPLDGGNLIIESEDLEPFVDRDPRSKKFIKRIIGAREFINNLPRYCLWLVDSTPTELRSIKPIRERVEACREFRLSSKVKSTQKFAQTPWLFREQINPERMLVVPRVSSERREYIPIGYLDSETIASDAVLIVPNAKLDLFGILTSRLHMAWMRVVAGRLKSDYRYSAQIVYNNFPFHKPTPDIAITAKKILDARSKYPDSSLAELYDPNFMPIDLRKAHEENDRAVFECYGISRKLSDEEIAATLLEIYSELAKIVDGE